MEAPIFIVGASRSGTTMLRLMLNAHSELGVPHEFKYFNTAPHLDWENWRRPKMPEAQYKQFVHGFLQRRRHVFEEMGIEEVAQKILRSQVKDLREPYRIAAETWARHYGKRRWGEKTPHNLFYADVLYDMFPDARFVHMVRDPRAVVSSMNRIAYFSDDTALNSFNWLQAVTVGCGLLERHVPESQRLTLRYEDLVAHPEREARALCTFIGIPFEPAMLDFHIDSSKYMGPVIRTTAVTQPVSRDHVAKWKETLSARDCALVESICSRAMARFGYETAGVALDATGHLNKAVKTAYWKWKSRGRLLERGYTIHYPMFSRARQRVNELRTHIPVSRTSSTAGDTALRRGD